MEPNIESAFVICIQSEDYPASLEVRKIYQRLPDDEAATHQLLRVIDESGEDYLYPETYSRYYLVSYTPTEKNIVSRCENFVISTHFKG